MNVMVLPRESIQPMRTCSRSAGEGSSAARLRSQLKQLEARKKELQGEVVPHGLKQWRYVLPLWSLLAIFSGVVALVPHRLCFSKSAVTEGGISLQRERLNVPYAEIHEVQVLVTPSQRRAPRGVAPLGLSSNPFTRPWVRWAARTSSGGAATATARGTAG